MKHHAKERFPQHAAAIDALGQSNPDFDDLCRKYGEVAQQLQAFENSPKIESLPESDSLKKRRAALEEELLLYIDTNRF